MYQLLKVVHVFAVIIFMGNIITGLFWKMHADGTKNPAIIAHMLRGLIRADRWFTIPGVVVITVGGMFAAIQAGLPILRTGWIFWSLLVFSLSGIAFAWRIAPLQKQLLSMSEGGPELDWEAYRTKSLQWEAWGLVATVLPGIAVVLMIWKPNVPGM